MVMNKVYLYYERERYKNDLNMFQNGYQYYMKNVDTKLFNKLNTMFQFYSNFEDNRKELDIPSNEIYEDLFENRIYHT